MIATKKRVLLWSGACFILCLGVWSQLNENLIFKLDRLCHLDHLVPRKSHVQNWQLKTGVFLNEQFFQDTYYGTSSAINSTSSVIHLGVSNKHSEQLTCEPSNKTCQLKYRETRRFNPSHSTLAGPSSNPSTRKDEILAGAAAHAVNRCCISLDLGEILVKKICKIMFTKQVCILTSDQSPWSKQCKTHLNTLIIDDGYSNSIDIYHI